MNANLREPFMRDDVTLARASEDDERAARAAALRAYRLTRTALPPVLPTKMPPQQIEFWAPSFVEVVRQWKQRLFGRPVLPGSADLGRS